MVMACRGSPRNMLSMIELLSRCLIYLRYTYQRWKIGPEIARGGESMFRLMDAPCEMQLILLLSLTHANTLQSKS